MFHKLALLKQLGYTPSAILDIGAYHGNWTDDMRKIYPNSKYFLFEGIDYPQLDRFSNDPQITVYKNTLLNDVAKEVEWYQEKNTGDSFFKEKTKHFVNTQPIFRETTTLDTIIAMDKLFQNENGHDHDNIMIKIDCQGAEINILKGASSIIGKTDFILLEMPLFGQYNEGVPNFLEHIQYMDSIGFIPYDIVDSHYFNHFNLQVDMLFINKNHRFNQDVQKSLY